MSPEAQRIAIAEACGWQPLLGDPWKSNGQKAWMFPGWSVERFIRLGEPAVYIDGLPDYLDSLDAMHEAEKAVGLHGEDFTGRKRKRTWAIHIRASNPRFATAVQRAEAFLRTLNLWTE